MVSKTNPNQPLQTGKRFSLACLVFLSAIAFYVSACQNSQTTHASRYGRIIAEGGNEQFQLQLASDAKLPGLQLLVEVQQEVAYPNVLVFVGKQPSKHPMADEDSQLLGRIDRKGIHRFIIPRELSREKKLTITLFDGVHPILIRQFSLKLKR
jgi:hypothetical protein